MPAAQPPPVAVVTDSTAALPESLAVAWGVSVVPLQVTVGTGSRADALGATSYDDSAAVAALVTRALQTGLAVTTSQPTPRRFAAAFRQAAAAGAAAVVSVHLSGAMSGTVEAARLAARDAPLPVHVVDSRSLGFGLGFAVLAAAQAARAGAGADEVARRATERAAATDVLFSVATLEHLRRGGRIGPAAAWLGTALAVKPLLHLRDGEVVPLERVRTTGRADERLAELAGARAGDREVDLAVHHLAAPERAGRLAGRLREQVPGARDLHLVEGGAVIAAHVGPGLLAVVVAPV